MRHPTRWLLRSGRPGARWLIRRRYDVRVLHAERFPASGPVVVAANHIGVIDGPLLAIFAPRPVHALTKIEMFEGPLGGFLRLVGQIPLDRARTDPQAIRTSVQVLEAGGAVGVFPEGTRGGIDAPLRFKRGVELLYGRLGLPVVPVALNSGLFWPGGAATRSGTVVVSYLAALAPGLPAAEFLRGTEGAIDRELNRWRPGAAAGLSAS